MPAKQTIFPVLGEPRYECHGVIDVDSTPSSILAQLLSSMDGNAVYEQGKWRVWAAGPATPETEVIDESWLNGGISFRTGTNKNERYNTATGAYINPLDYWADTNFPAVSIPEYVADDQEELSLDLNLPFTTSGFQAQRQARLAIEKSRRGMGITYPCNLKALKVRVNEVRKVNNAMLGWTEKLFRVADWQYAPTGGITLTLEEYDPAIYDVGTMEPLPEPDPTNLPSPWDVPAPINLEADEVLYSTNVSSVIKSSVVLSWDQESVGISYFEIQQKLTTDVSWTPLNPSTDNGITLPDIVPGAWEYRVRAVNGIGAKSDWASVTKTVYGKLANPEDVTGLAAELNLPLVELSWNHTGDIDRDHYEIRLGADWDTGVEIGRTPANKWAYPLPSSGVKAFWVRCVDTTDNASVTAASVSITVPAAAPPTGITCESVLFGISVDVAFAHTRDISYCEVWVSNDNNRDHADLLKQTENGHVSHDGLGTVAVRYYWARTINIFGEDSTWYPSGLTAGVQGYTLSDPTTLLQLLNEDVTSESAESYLTGHSTLISILDTRTMVFESGVVGTGVTATYTEALSQAASELNKNRTLLQTLNATVAGLLAPPAYAALANYEPGALVTGSDTYLYQCLASNGPGTAVHAPPNVTYWKPISDFATLLTDMRTDLDTATATWTSTATALAADIAALGGSPSGRVTIAETTILQHSDAITLQGTVIKGPLALVAGVVESGVQVESVGDVRFLDLEISRTRINMDTANANIVLAASRLDTSEQRLTTAELAIDAANAAILLRVTNNELSSEVSVLSDMIALKLDSGPISAGLAVSWTDDSHTKSNITAFSDTFRIAKPDGTGARTVFSVGMVGGVSAVGINGNLFVDGSISATKLATGELIVGTNVGMGTAVTSGGVTTIVNGIITTSSIELGGDIHLGKDSYSDNTAGFFLGDDGGTPKLNIGNSTNYLKWNGTSLSIRGSLNASDIASGTLNASVVNVENLNADNIIAGTFTGRTFKTAASGARVEITNGRGTVSAIEADGSYRYRLFENTNPSGGTTNTFEMYGFIKVQPVTNSFGDKANHSIVAYHGTQGNISLLPSSASGAPTHSADTGTFYVNSTGDLYYRKSATWFHVA